MGDPAELGPRLSSRPSQSQRSATTATDHHWRCATLAHTARTLDLQSGYDIVRYGETLDADLLDPVIFHMDNVGGFVEPGVESGAAGKAAAGYIEAAVELCAAGSIDAIATAPINKRALFLGGYGFPGHTEFLAHLTRTEEYAMALVAENLRTVWLSTHLPLSQAIRLVERDRRVRIINLAHRVATLGH